MENNLSLYQLNQEEQQILDLMITNVDEETGEIDPELQGIFNQIQVAKENKIKGCIYAIKKFENTYELAKKEKARIDGIMKTCEKASERIRTILADNLEVGKKYDLGTLSIGWRKSSSVEIENEEEFCKKYKDNSELVKTTIIYKPIKDNIKKLIQNGEKVEGAYLEEKENMQIK